MVIKSYFKLVDYLRAGAYKEMTEEEFDNKYVETLDTVLLAMAESSEIDPEKFYSIACVLENLRFFSPVLYGALQTKKKLS